MSVWVIAATVLRLPVSTTHAVVGALIGAGLLLDPRSIHWWALATSVAVPLLVSALVAFAVSALLALAARALTAGERRSSARQPGFYGVIPPLVVPRMSPGARTVGHWLSAGAVGAARGLNDTPKLVAIGALSLVPAGVSIETITFVVAGAMFFAAVAAGIPVAQRLGEGVVALDHGEGLRANITTSVLVTAGAAAGLPMSTTHVSTGAIAGTSGTRLARLQTRTLRDFAVAWIVTPPAAGIVAAAVYLFAG